MKPLFVLVAAFIVSLIVIKVTTGEINYSLSGRIAMCAMLLFTAIGHFAFTKGMALMMPGFIPFKRQLVYCTGLIEITAAIGLLLPRIKEFTACMLIVFFILVLPVNINAAIRRLDHEKADGNGPGAQYLWFRIPLQALFIVWVWWFALLH